MDSDTGKAYDGDVRLKQENINNGYSKIPNIFEMWKKIYFMTEESMAELFKSAVSTDGFAGGMNQFLNHYLDFEKFFRKNLDNYFETAEMPSKKDIARVAGLVIGVEDKVDNIEANLESNLDRLVENLISIADRLAAEKEKEVMREREIVYIKDKLDNLTEDINVLKSQVGDLSSLLGQVLRDLTRKGSVIKKASIKAAENMDKDRHKTRSSVPVPEETLQPAPGDTEENEKDDGLKDQSKDGNFPINEDEVSKP